jgi:hypothetical protein
MRDNMTYDIPALLWQLKYVVITRTTTFLRVLRLALTRNAKPALTRVQAKLCSQKLSQYTVQCSLFSPTINTTMNKGM